MGDATKKLDKKFRIKNQQKNMEKTNTKYTDQAYRPDTEVKLTGEQFLTLKKLIQDIRGERIIRVIDNGGQTLGQGLSYKDFDVENLYAYCEQLHRKNVDEGITIPLDQLRKEYEEESKKETPAVTQEEVKQEVEK